MSTEPTEEQKQAAQDFCAEHMLCCDDFLAQLLAGREAKLTEPYYERRIADALRARDEIGAENNTLRAELEHFRRRLVETDTEASEARARVAELEGQYSRRVQSHTEDLERLYAALASVCIDILTSPAVTDTMWRHDRGLSTTVDYIAGVLGIDTVDAYGKPTTELVRLAHYDDAKADAGAFESWCYDVGGGAAADDGAVGKAHDTEGGEG